MDKITQQGVPTLGVDAPSITPELVKEYLKKDLAVAVSCLNAMLSDPDLLEYLATFMAGRWNNVQNSKANGTQK